MIEYGYMNENGCLTSKILEEYPERYWDEGSGEVKERIISVKEQVYALSKIGWKPVHLIDDSRTVSNDANYFILPVPYDAGEYITYEYQKIFDIRKVKDRIKDFKQQLQNEDYKITKCYEASLLGLDMPYNVADLHQERQAVRDEINRLEALIASN